MKFILKDGTEFMIGNLSYKHMPEATYNQDYMISVISEEPQETIESVKSLFTPENLSKVTIITDDGNHTFEFSFTKYISVDLYIVESFQESSFTVTLQ